MNKETILGLIIIVLVSVVFLSISTAYKCGEYEGQREQYSFYEFSQQTGAKYAQLHQFRGGLLNPFCE